MMPPAMCIESSASGVPRSWRGLGGVAGDGVAAISLGLVVVLLSAQEQKEEGSLTLSGPQSLPTEMAQSKNLQSTNTK